MDKTKKLYLAGHRGLVGAAIHRRLQKSGYDNLLTRTHAQLDLLDQKKVRNFFEKEKPAYVVLAAARVGGIKANSTYPADFLYQNLQIQNSVIWAAHECGVEKLMFLGSSCIYPRLAPQPMKEEYLLDGKPEPTNEGYALAKISGLKLCEKIYEQYGKKFISCMPTNIYGPGDHFDPETSHVIPALMGRMHKAKLEKAPEFVVWGDGTARREFLYVDDLAEAVVFLMERYNEKTFVNIGTGEDMSIGEIAEEIKKVVGYEGKIVFDATKPGGMPRKLLDMSKLSLLGWKYSTPLKDGLKKTYSYYKSIAPK
jgi:GDP-L-fucose synthase